MTLSLKLILTAAAVVALLAAGARLAYPWLEPARLLHSVHGIDVSHHQGSIDWQQIAQTGVSFAYIKATEGGDFVDPRFAENWRGADEANIQRGGYHFFTQCKPGADQAQNFIRTVPKEIHTLAPVVDAEHMGPCRHSPQVKDVVTELSIFMDLVELHFGKRPVIYTTREFHDAHLKGHFDNEKFWIRSLGLPPMFRRNQWTIWQYHNRGRRKGDRGSCGPECDAPRVRVVEKPSSWFGSLLEPRAAVN